MTALTYAGIPAARPVSSPVNVVAAAPSPSRALRAAFAASLRSASSAACCARLPSEPSALAIAFPITCRCTSPRTRASATVATVPHHPAQNLRHLRRRSGRRSCGARRHVARHFTASLPTVHAPPTAPVAAAVPVVSASQAAKSVSHGKNTAVLQRTFRVSHAPAPPSVLPVLTARHRPAASGILPFQALRTLPLKRRSG